MIILHCSSVCSTKKFNELYVKAKVKPAQQTQKYYKLLVDGFSYNNVKVNVFSSLFVNKRSLSGIFYFYGKDFENNVMYEYLPFINVPILRHIYLFFACFIKALIWCGKNRKGVLIWNILDVSFSPALFLASKLTGRLSVGIMTDIPMDPFRVPLNRITLKDRIETKIYKFIMDRFDSYIFLTENMNKITNKRNKPYIVIEGQVDIKLKNSKNDLNNKYKKKVCIYAGAIKKIFGIELLVKAFIKADVKDAELHIYGDGDYKEELIEIMKKHKNIQYFGVVHNDKIIEEQKKASLLVNPRPSNEEYTKYSFPSKTLEYMASGTPLLTTDLPGIPEEYKKKIYIFQNETIDGFAKTLENILSKSKEELHQKGMEAKRFVFKSKNNIIQSKKIINMINEFYD